MPRHARFDFVMLLRWSSAVHWVTLAALVVAGSAWAYTRGSAWATGPDVPPPAHAAPAWAPRNEAAYVGVVTSYPAPPGSSTAAGRARSSAAATPVGKEALGLAADGIPVTALQAYEDAANREAMVRPDCHLPWQLLAGIGRVESDHGRFGGATLYADGLSVPAIIGIPLNGDGTALIRDTDHGALDGDTVYDHAVGPMQFIPSTWATYGVDGNNDGKIDPFNIFDAAAAAADYLCIAGGDLSTAAGQRRAVEAYNHSDAYVRLVMQVEAVYADGASLFTTPEGPSAPPTSPVTLPPVDPGRPPAGSPSLSPAAPSPDPSRTGRSATDSPPDAPPSSTQPAPGSDTPTDSPTGSAPTSAPPACDPSATSGSPASSAPAGSSTAPCTSTDTGSSAAVPPAGSSAEVTAPTATDSPAPAATS